jgi:hypothetical protein
MSCAIIGLHGALRVPDDLFLDDTDVSVVTGDCCAACCDVCHTGWQVA